MRSSHSQPERIGTILSTNELALSIHRAPAPRGVGIVVPAFLDGKDGPAASSLAAALPGIGLTGITFDPRGTWDSPGYEADIAPSRQLADIQLLLDEHPAERVVLIGQCYGALLALLAAADDRRVTDVVALMPSRCFIWPDNYDRNRDSWRIADPKPFLRKQEGRLREFWIPHSVVEDALNYELPVAIQTLRVPTLFVAGLKDELIGVKAVERLHNECGSNAKRLVTLPVQHDYRDDLDQTALVRNTVLHWLRSPTLGRANQLHG